VTQYYIWSNDLLQGAAAPLRIFSDQIHSIPLLAVFVLGLIGVFSPCQVSTNAAILTFATRNIGRPGGGLRPALIYTLGKALVYGLVGIVVIGLGVQLDQASVPLVVAVRKAMGPLLVVTGLVMAGRVRFSLPALAAVGRRITERAPLRGDWSAFFMGVAFAFAACPTLFVLFFVILVPLSLTSRWGLLMPLLFAFGTTFPILAITSLIDLGWEGAGRGIQDISRVTGLVSRGAGVIFVLIGVNEIFLYWRF